MNDKYGKWGEHFLIPFIIIVIDIAWFKKLAGNCFSIKNIFYCILDFVSGINVRKAFLR